MAGVRPTTTSSSARARRAACWPTACRPTRRRRVLLLEAGGKDNYHWIHIPVGYLYLMGNPRTDWGYKTAAGAGPQRPQPQLSARQGAGRLLVHQRHDLHARPGARLRPVAADGQSRLGLGRRAALLQEASRTSGRWSPTPSTGCTRAAANGASSSRASAGRSSTPSATRRPRPASPRSTTSTAATTRAAATSTSTRRRACAGTRPRASCARSRTGAT